MPGRGKRSQASLHTYMGIELHKVDTGESERELALDWIRSQGGEKHGRRRKEDAFYSPFNLL